MSDRNRSQLELALDPGMGRTIAGVFDIESLSADRRVRSERCFGLRWRPGARVRTWGAERASGDDSIPGDRPEVGEFRFRVPEHRDAASADLYEYRAVLESRVVALAIAEACEDNEGEGMVRDALQVVRFPPIDVGFGEQLDVLYRRLLAHRRDGAVDRGASLDWAIERVVAELYEVDLPDLVRLQSHFADGGES